MICEFLNKYPLFFIVVFFLFVMPLIEKQALLNKEEFSDDLNEYLVNVKNKADTLKCSKSCCKWTQWPVPHMNNNNNIGSNLTCSGGNESGCVCIDEENIQFLDKQGL
jgi:hypothetical protein